MLDVCPARTKRGLDINGGVTILSETIFCLEAVLDRPRLWVESSGSVMVDVE